VRFNARLRKRDQAGSALNADEKTTDACAATAEKSIGKGAIIRDSHHRPPDA